MTQTAVSPPAAPPAAPPPVDVPAWKLLAVLGGGGAVAGAVLVVAYSATQPRIQAHRAAVLREAVREVLAGPEEVETLWLEGGRLVAADPAAGADASKTERVWIGRRADGTRAGVAVLAAEPGFADDIQILLGFDPERRVLLGFRVLSSKETPGLGDAIEKDARWTGQFPGKSLPLVAVKKGRSRGDTAHEIETITGATVSSSAVVRIIDHAVERWTPLVAAWQEAQR